MGKDGHFVEERRTVNMNEARQTQKMEEEKAWIKNMRRKSKKKIKKMGNRRTNWCKKKKDRERD